eukprot:712980-Rhodomonas_salina.3
MISWGSQDRVSGPQTQGSVGSRSGQYPLIVEKLAHSDSSELKVVATIQSGGSEGVLTQKPVTGLCDDVKQYAGYFNVTTGAALWIRSLLRSASAFRG